MVIGGERETETWGSMSRSRSGVENSRSGIDMRPTGRNNTPLDNSTAILGCLCQPTDGLLFIFIPLVRPKEPPQRDGRYTGYLAQKQSDRRADKRKRKKRRRRSSSSKDRTHGIRNRRDKRSKEERERSGRLQDKLSRIQGGGEGRGEKKRPRLVLGAGGVLTQVLHLTWPGSTWPV